jgi:hypothetical protein
MRLFSLTGFAAVLACLAAAADEASPLAAGNQDAKAQTAGRVEPGDPAGAGPCHTIAADVSAAAGPRSGR